jgi:hypothetical protein
MVVEDVVYIPKRGLMVLVDEVVITAQVGGCLVQGGRMWRILGIERGRRNAAFVADNGLRPTPGPIYTSPPDT